MGGLAGISKGTSVDKTTLARGNVDLGRESRRESSLKLDIKTGEISISEDVHVIVVVQRSEDTVLIERSWHLRRTDPEAKRGIG